MNANWMRNAPIDRQLRDRAVAMILDGSLSPGDVLPTVPSAAADLRVNPLTVARAYRQLVAEELVEERDGLGMCIAPDAPEKLRRTECDRFFRECWPAITNCMKRLGIQPPALQPADCLH